MSEFYPCTLAVLSFPVSFLLLSVVEQTAELFQCLSIGSAEGLTKVLLDPTTKMILGTGMVATNAGELLAEAVLALEMDADIEDIALTVHPHPTLSETLNFACEVTEGTCTDITDI